MTYTRPPDDARIKPRWPRTPLGWIWLRASALYVILWIAFYNSPEFKMLLLGTPYVGPAIPWFGGLFLVAFVIWAIWKLYV